MTFIILFSSIWQPPNIYVSLRFLEAIPIALARLLTPPYDILLVNRDGKLCELHKSLDRDCSLKMVTAQDIPGIQTYERSAVFLMLTEQLRLVHQPLLLEQLYGVVGADGAFFNRQRLGGMIKVMVDGVEYAYPQGTPYRTIAADVQPRFPPGRCSSGTPYPPAAPGPPA